MIPKKIHRIWLGPKKMPPRYVKYGERWQELHPDWDIHDWTKEEIEDLPLRNRDVWDALAEGANSGVPMPPQQAIAVQRADVVGYELMRLFGGIYVNCDIEPLRNIEPLLERFPDRCVVGKEDQRFCCNAVMIGPPEADLWVEVTEELGPSFFDNRWGMMNQTTGPWLLTRTIEAKPHLATVLPKVTFYPVHYSTIPAGQHAPEGTYPQSWTLHHWGHRLTA